MMPVRSQAHGLVRTYGVLAASEGSPPTERLQSENLNSFQCEALSFLTFFSFELGLSKSHWLR